MHIICTWHHLKNLKNVLKNSTEIPDFIEMIIPIVDESLNSNNEIIAETAQIIDERINTEE